MASVASGASTHSGAHEHLLDLSSDDETWAFINASTSSHPSSMGMMPSPESGSMASWGFIGQRVEPSPPAPSPLELEPERPAAYATQFPPDQTSSVGTLADFLSSSGVTSGDMQEQFMLEDFLSEDAMRQIAGSFILEVREEVDPLLTLYA